MTKSRVSSSMHKLLEWLLRLRNERMLPICSGAEGTHSCRSQPPDGFASDRKTNNNERVDVWREVDKHELNMSLQEFTEKSNASSKLEQTTFSARFDMQEILGRGTFARVYKCVERESGKEFAVKKIITKAHEDAREVDERGVVNEVEIWRTLRHRNIVALFATFYQDSELCIVMELVQGTTLFDEIIHQTVFCEKQACCIIHQLLEALDYMHRKRIVHRDIKADNVLLQHGKTNQNHFTVKLTVFGLARRLPRDSDVITCDVEGAPLYLAPETVLEDPIGRSVDIWGCGVILHLLLVGFPPFWNDDDSKLLSLIVEGRFAMPARYWDDVTDDAKDLVRRMLVVHPHKRIAASKALNHPWITDFIKAEKENIGHHRIEMPTASLKE